MDLEDILEHIQKAQLNGWGGLCPYAAVAINSYFFKEQLPYYLTVNRYLYEQEGEPRGHVALHFNLVGEDFYLDSDGTEKPIEMIDSWGVVDFDDDDERKEFETLSFRFDDSDEMLKFWGIDPEVAEPLIVSFTEQLHLEQE